MPFRSQHSGSGGGGEDDEGGGEGEGGDCGGGGGVKGGRAGGIPRLGNGFSDRWFRGQGRWSSKAHCITAHTHTPTGRRQRQHGRSSATATPALHMASLQLPRTRPGHTLLSTSRAAAESARPLHHFVFHFIHLPGGERAPAATTEAYQATRPLRRPSTPAPHA